MSNVSQIVIIICLVIIGIFASRKIAMWQMKKAFDYIVSDLKARGALTPETAVEVPYNQTKRLQLGLKDYRPRIFNQMITEGMIGVVEDGNKFYLNESAIPEPPADN